MSHVVTDKQHAFLTEGDGILNNTLFKLLQKKVDFKLQEYTFICVA